MNAGRTGVKRSLQRAFQRRSKVSIASPNFLTSNFSTSATAFAATPRNRTPQVPIGGFEPPELGRREARLKAYEDAVKIINNSLPKPEPSTVKPHVQKQRKVKPEDIGLNRDPIKPEPLSTSPRGIRNTSFRLPYLSNLKKMDPTFDDPYDVAISAIRKVQKPGDPEIIIDPDGIYEDNDTSGNPSLDDRDDREGVDEEGEYADLVAATGYSAEFIQGLKTRRLVRRWVRNQTRMGKIPSYYTLSIAGDENGLIGFGEGKSSEPDIADRMAEMRAIKDMKPILRFEERTVYGELFGKFGATRIEIRARNPGFGIRANFYVNEICRIAGLTDISAKVRGSLNGMNIAKAVFKVLREQKSPEQIARERGVQVIDVRQRYFHAYVPRPLD